MANIGDNINNSDNVLANNKNITSNDQSLEANSTCSNIAKTISNKNEENKNSEIVCSLMEMMKMSSINDIAQKMCLMSQLPLLCKEMRRYGYLPMLVQLLHQQTENDPDDDDENDTGHNKHRLKRTSKARRDIIKALTNIINHTSKNCNEIKILNILEDLNAFVEIIYNKFEKDQNVEQENEIIDHPCNLIIELYKLCSEQESIEFILQFGGIYVISDVRIYFIFIILY